MLSKKTLVRYSANQSRRLEIIIPLILKYPEKHI